MAGKSEWVGHVGREWTRRADVMDAMLGPFGAAGAAALGDLAGRQVLDLGCGAGESTFDLARRGAARVLGVDVSPDLIELAEARAAKADAPAAEFRLADAAEAALGGPFDALFSRFGAMFFDDTTTAFAHLRGQCAPGAPLSIVCWRSPRENEWATLGLNAAMHLLPQDEAGPPKGGPGPFAWAKPEATFAPALEEAGWRDVAWGPLDLPMKLGVGMEGPGVAPGAEAATAFSMRIGPLASRTRGMDDQEKAAIAAAVAEAMLAREENGAVTVNGACWLISASA